MLVFFINLIKSFGIFGEIFCLTFFRTAMSGSRWEVFTRISNSCWDSSVLHSWSCTSYYTLMAFLIMLLVMLLFMLMVLLSTLSVTKHLICGNNWNWLLNLNLNYETLDWGRKWLVD